MPHRPRVKLAGIPQHIVQRSIEREPCFPAEEDCPSDLHWQNQFASAFRNPKAPPTDHQPN